MELKKILTSVEDNICTITINRPDKMNALDKDVFTELEWIVDDIQQNSLVRSAVITGAGNKAFVAGADITEFSKLNKEEAMMLSKRGQDIFSKIENSKKPIVAAVNGFALGGGCELAMACHFRLCSNNAKFGQPEVNLGLIPGYGGTQRLPRLIGIGKAMELSMSGNMLNAEEALQSGLVNYVTTPEELLPRTKEVLKTINAKAPIAISHIISTIKTAIYDPKNGYKSEVESFGECFTTNDMQEGTAAFLEKRKPVFTGS